MIGNETTVITTDRLVLRPYRIEDFDDMRALMARPETFRFPRRPPLSREESWSRLLRHIGHWAALGYGFMAVHERDGGRFVGEAGLSRFRRDCDPAIEDLPEATWTMIAEVQGRGYATEAAKAAQLWTEAALVPARTACMVDPDNAASLRVAAKLDFRETRRVIHKESPTIVFERPGPGA